MVAGAGDARLLDAVEPDAAADAADDPTLPNPNVAPDPQCAFRGAMEEITLATDLATSTGTLRRMSTGVNHFRNIKYRLVPDTHASFVLVFLGYGPGDFPPIMNFHGTSQPREHMTVGKSIIARVAVVGNLARIFDREVDLHTGMTYQTRDHSYPCALIDNEFSAAHPDEFLPRR